MMDSLAVHTSESFTYCMPKYCADISHYLETMVA